MASRPVSKQGTKICNSLVAVLKLGANQVAEGSDCHLYTEKNVSEVGLRSLASAIKQPGKTTEFCGSAS